MCSPSLKSKVCFRSMQAAYHQRMDVLTNMGLVCLFSFAACLKHSEVWDSKVHFFKSRLANVLNLKRVATLWQQHVRLKPLNPVGFLLRQGGWCPDPQHGWQCHAPPGYSCVSDFWFQWLAHGKRSIWQISSKHSGITEVQRFHTQVILEGRRQEAWIFCHNHLRLTSCHMSMLFISVHAILKSRSHGCRKPGIPKCGIGKPALPANVLLVSWLQQYQNRCLLYICAWLSRLDFCHRQPWSFSSIDLRLVYLSKKGVTFAIENPTTSLLFRYKPLRATWMQDFVLDSCLPIPILLQCLSMDALFLYLMIPLAVPTSIHLLLN